MASPTGSQQCSATRHLALHGHFRVGSGAPTCWLIGLAGGGDGGTRCRRERPGSLAGAVPCRARAQEASGLGAALPARAARASERKSAQPMAASLGLSGHDQLRHFIASPAWEDAPLWRVLAEEADRLVGGREGAVGGDGA